MALFIGLVSMNAQDKEADSTKQGWTRSGQFQVLFNQSAFNNNWTAGGVSSIAGNLSLNYDFVTLLSISFSDVILRHFMSLYATFTRFCTSFMLFYVILCHFYVICGCFMSLFLDFAAVSCYFTLFYVTFT